MLSLNDALSVINKLETFDLNDPSAPRLGLRLSARSEALLDSPRGGFSFRRALEPLITTEFENLAELAGRFSRKEVRGTGRLAVAKLYVQTESEGRTAIRPSTPKTVTSSPENFK